MDNEAFRNDLVKILQKMPPVARDKVRDVVSFAFANKDMLEKSLEGSMEIMMPHIGALATEKAMGYLDMKEVEQVVKDALTAVGVEIPSGA